MQLCALDSVCVMVQLYLLMLNDHLCRLHIQCQVENGVALLVLWDEVCRCSGGIGVQILQA